MINLDRADIGFDALETDNNGCMVHVPFCKVQCLCENIYKREKGSQGRRGKKLKYKEREMTEALAQTAADIKASRSIVMHIYAPSPTPDLPAPLQLIDSSHARSSLSLSHLSISAVTSSSLSPLPWVRVIQGSSYKDGLLRVANF